MGEIIVAVFGIYLILQMIIGYRRGLIKSMLNLASWILTFAIAYKGAAYFKEIVIQNVPEIQGTIVTDRIAYMIAYMGLMIVCKIIFSVVIRLANKVTRVPGVGFINKVAGAALGLIKGSLIIMVVVFFISLMPHVGMESEYAQIVGGSEVMQTMVETNPLEQMIKQQIQIETQKLLQQKKEGILQMSFNDSFAEYLFFEIMMRVLNNKNRKNEKRC